MLWMVALYLIEFVSIRHEKDLIDVFLEVVRIYLRTWCYISMALHKTVVSLKICTYGIKCKDSCCRCLSYQYVLWGCVIYFLHDRPWISLWIKSISNKLDITCHVWTSQLSGHCDTIGNRLWRHQQNVKRTSETRGRCVKIPVLIVIYTFVVSCKK